VELLIGLVLGLLAAIVGAILGAVFWDRWLQPTIENKPLRQVLNFDSRVGMLFLFPTQKPLPGRFLRTVNLEDMRAVDYVNGGLLLAGVAQEQIRLKGAERWVPDDRENNLVVIGSPKRNQISHRVLAALREHHNVDWDFIQSPGDPSRWELLFNGTSYISPSHGQAKEARERGILEPEIALDDYALVSKLSRLPRFSPNTKILIIAGIRGIGTWGAAKYVRERAGEIQKYVGTSDFGAVLKITYDDWRIVEMEIERIVDLDRPRVDLGRHV
jgi:hypothetical protein